MTTKPDSSADLKAFEAAEKLPDDAFMQPLESTSREALIQMVYYYQAQDGLIESAQDEVKKLRGELAEVQRPLDAQMARLKQRVIELNTENESLRAAPLAKGVLVGWMRPDELWKAKVSPQLCRVHPEKDKHPDMVPVYMAARDAQGEKP